MGWATRTAGLGLVVAISVSMSCGRTDRREAPDRTSVFEIASGSLSNGEVGVPYDAPITVVASPVPARIDWQVQAGSLPPGIALLPEGTSGARLVGVPAAPGRYDFTLQAKDDFGRTARRDLSLQIGANDPLRIVTETLPSGVREAEYRAVLEASGGQPPYLWRLSDGRLPAGLLLRADGDVFFVEGTVDEPGRFGLEFEVQDFAGATDRRTFVLNLLVGGDELVVLADGLPPVTAGDAYSAPIRAVGGNPPYRWEQTGGQLPEGLSIDSTGTPATTLRGTTQSPGDYLVNITVFDQVGNSDSEDFLITVDPPQDRLRIITNTLAPGRVGEFYQEPITAAGGAAPYEWSISQGGLPRGTSMSIRGTPSTSIQGTPQVSERAQFVVRVSDAAGSVAVRAFVVEVEPPIPPLVLITQDLPNGNQGRPYTAVLEASGGQPPYTWEVTGGVLPPGLSMPLNGTPDNAISGVLTATGIFSFEITLRDQRGRSVSRRFEVDVGPPPTPPTILPVSAPAGRRCEGYHLPISVSGGFGMLAWSISAGSLPPGILLQPSGALGGVLSGHPTAAGTYNFTVRLQDEIGQTDQVSLTIVVADVVDAPRWAVLTGPLLNSVRDVFISNVCGTTPTPAVRAATGNGRLFSNFVELASDNRSLAFIGDYRRSSVQELWLVALTGSTPGPATRVHLQGDLGRDVRSFASSPDGRWIAFSGDLEQNGRADLWVVDVQNPQMPGVARKVSSPTVVTNNQVTEILWSPDSQTIAFRGIFELAGRLDLYLTSVTSTVGHRRVSAFTDAQSDVLGAAWNPQGNGLAYLADQDVGNQFDLYWLPINATGPAAPVRVSNLRTNGDVRNGRFGFSADGRRLAYVATQDSNADELYGVDLTGAVGPTTAVKLHPPYAASRDVGFVQWAPTGARLVYVADQDRDNVQEIYTVDYSGSTPTSPTRFNAPVSNSGDVRFGGSNLAWSPDGNWVAYLVNEFSAVPSEIYVTDLRSPTFVTRAVGPARMDPNLDARALQFAANRPRLMVVGDYRSAGVTEAYWTDLSGVTPTAAARLNPDLVNNGDVSWVQGSLAWRSDGSAAYYVADQVMDFTTEAWSVSLLGGVVAPAVRMHSALPLSGRVERILVQQ